MTGTSDESKPLTRSLRVVALACTYIAASTLLIRYNKFLMDGRFPHALALSSLHMGCSLLFCVLLYLLRPSAFPGMAATEGRRRDLLRWFVPIGIFFAISLYASNQAYVYCNVSFLQFMKEGNVILTFLISCAVGLQIMNRVRMAVVLWIVLGSTMCVSGDLHFVLIGFVTQLISQLAECSRVVLGEFVLSGSNFRLDPLTYTMFAAPACLVALLVGIFATWDPVILRDGLQWWPYLLPNMTLAFILNVLVATVIKEVSAVGFILAGVCKDIVLVLISAMVFGESVTRGQALSFTVVLGGILVWSFMKSAPEHELVRAVEDFMRLPRSEGKVGPGRTEGTPLQKSKV